MMLIISLETTYMNNNVNKKQQLKALKDKLASKNIASSVTPQKKDIYWKRKIKDSSTYKGFSFYA